MQTIDAQPAPQQQHLARIVVSYIVALVLGFGAMVTLMHYGW